MKTVVPSTYGNLLCTGFPAEPRNLENLEICICFGPGPEIFLFLFFYFFWSRSRNSLESPPLPPPSSVKTWKKQGIYQNTLITSGMLRYRTFSFYIKTIFSKFCVPTILECLSHQPFGATIVLTKTWRMAILTWTKPGDILQFYG